MQRVGIVSFKALASAAGVSPRQIRRLRQGEIAQMRVETVLKLAQVLQVQINVLVKTFSINPAPPQTDDKTIDTLKQEYQRLQNQLSQQRQTLLQEFQLSSLQVLESCILQLPTFAFKVQQNPEISATKLLPLMMRPLEQLLQQWGIEQIAPVGSKLPYNEQLHQLLQGNAQPGDLVTVRYTGYVQGDKLLYRAKVGLIE